MRRLARDGKVLTHPHSHLRSDVGMHSTMQRQDLRVHPEHRVLQFGVVGDNSTRNDRRRSWSADQLRHEQPARE